MLINDLKLDCIVHKYVDDITLTELTYILHTKPSSMQSSFHQLLNWADQNDMVVNLTKTKMVFGPPSITSNLHPISASSYQIQRASEAKLLGEHIDSNLSWHTHVEAIVSKATQRLYF